MDARRWEGAGFLEGEWSAEVEWPSGVRYRKLGAEGFERDGWFARNHFQSDLSHPFSTAARCTMGDSWYSSRMFLDAPSDLSTATRLDNPPGLRLAAVAAVLFENDCLALGDQAVDWRSHAPETLVEQGGTPEIVLKAWAGALQHSDPLRLRAWNAVDRAGAEVSGQAARAGVALARHWPSLPGDRSWLHWLRETDARGGGPCGALIFGWRCGVLGLSAERCLAAACFLERSLTLLEQWGMSLSRERLEAKILEIHLPLPPEFVRSLMMESDLGDDSVLSAV